MLLTVNAINEDGELEQIILEDMLFKLCNSLDAELINNVKIEIIKNQYRNTIDIYLTSLLRAETLQNTVKTIELRTPEYPENLWNCFKQAFNNKFKTKFHVCTTFKSTTKKVTFERIAVYPRMPSLHKDYKNQRIVFKESIKVEDLA